MTGESDGILKSAIKDGKIDGDPVIYDKTDVREGKGSILVLAVGESTFLNSMCTAVSVNQMDVIEGISWGYHEPYQFVSTLGLITTVVTVVLACIQLWGDATFSWMQILLV